MNSFFNNTDLIWNTLKFFEKKELYQFNRSCYQHGDDTQLNYKLNVNQLKELSSLSILFLNQKKRFFNKWLKYKNFIDKHQDFQHYTSQVWDYPVLDFNRNFVGSTGYIDNIYDTDVNYPLMRGIDSYQRHFIVIRYKLLNNNIANNSVTTLKKINFRKDDIYTLTIFQRYTDGTSWCKAGPSNQGPLLNDTNTCLTPDEIIMLFERINSMINNQFFYLRNFRDHISSDDTDFNLLKIFCQLV